MITSTGNNFGGSAIEIKDYQSEKLIVLNAKFDIDTTSEAYQRADVLEIYVPDLTLNKSAEAACYMHSYYSEKVSYGVLEYSLGTVLRTWLKDRNTICIEKLPIYDDLGHITIILATLYIQRGKRVDIEKSTNTRLVVTYENNDAYESEVACIVEEGWCFFHCQLDDTADYYEDDIIIHLENFPTDVSVDMVMAGCLNNSDYKGAGMFIGKVENGTITIPKPCSSGRATSWDPFIFFYAVRDGENVVVDNQKNDTATTETE